MVATQSRPSSLPPDEKFWVHYSPHHEFSLSTVLSLVLHTLGFGLLILCIVKAWPVSEAMPLERVPIRIAGGGGDVKGQDDAVPGAKAAPQRHENISDEKPQVVAADQDKPKTQIEQITPRIPRVDLPPDRVLETADGDPIARFKSLKEQMLSLGSPPTKGQGGSGNGGGKGPGSGTGNGGFTGPGDQNISVRERRQLRRTMRFSTQSGDDYRRQLAALGAILAVAEPDKNGKPVYRVFRDLEHVPAAGKIEDIRKLDRIFWTDDDKRSVGSLSQSLQIKVPHAITAFFSKNFEKMLLEKELKYRGVDNEWQIKETVFEVVPAGKSWKVRVASQELYPKP